MVMVFSSSSSSSFPLLLEGKIRSTSTTLFCTWYSVCATVLGEWLVTDGWLMNEQ